MPPSKPGRPKSRPRRLPRMEAHADRITHDTLAMRAATFADMLKLQPEIRRRLKLPPWLQFILPYERKDQANLTEVDQQRFVCAFNILVNNGTLGPLVDIHGDPAHQPHTTQRFLPW